MTFSFWVPCVPLCWPQPAMLSMQGSQPSNLLHQLLRWSDILGAFGHCLVHTVLSLGSQKIGPPEWHWHIDYHWCDSHSFGPRESSALWASDCLLPYLGLQLVPQAGVLTPLCPHQCCLRSTAAEKAVVAKGVLYSLWLSHRRVTPAFLRAVHYMEGTPLGWPYLLWGFWNSAPVSVGPSLSPVPVMTL